MFKRILLPLDGSEAAEAVIPYAEEMAKRMGSTLILFHACEDSHRQARGMHKLYMDKLAEIISQKINLSGQQTNVLVEQRMGEFTSSLCEYIENNDISLVILVAHGFTSPSAKSIVDDVVRLAKCPTMLVRHERQPEGDRGVIRRILVPLDGTPYAQQILSVARRISENFKADIVLFSAVKSAGRTAADIENQKKEASKYLDGVAATLPRLNVTPIIAETNDFATAIDEAAFQSKSDMVTMVTNSRVTEWAENSISRKILNTGATSLLIVHRK
ncbi:universal stress protein [Dehalogenimonas etheniformans]|uniref:Universal stress protein n=1 Tax=Dehalogenimonas etheniformans TaxID=1536648 RepID=A0A2P5P8X5_9CHLR|nr:universal stress protein [Dehalogenimonas etheniformans]PPD58744.1 universal stress protein [Dehalogenimonas etheniformans]QNT76487.1 universal stress protein [Dehalogenimonas etheniformans]